MFRFDVEDGWWVDEAARARGVRTIETNRGARDVRAARGGARRRLVEDWMLADDERGAWEADRQARRAPGEISPTGQPDSS